MRHRNKNGDLSVHAIAGTYVTLLGLDLPEGSPALDGLLGFGIHRTNHTENKEGWLPGIKRFKRDGGQPSTSKLSSTREHPLQGFLWSDYGVEAGCEYTYKVVPLYGEPRRLVEGDSVSIRFSAEPESDDHHSIYFNRGAAASQAYARRFQNRPPDRVKNPEAYPWLSRGLEEALIRFIERADGESYGLRAAVYEFQYDPVLQAMKTAADNGADVRIVYDCKPGEGKPGERNARSVDAAGLDDETMTRKRCANSSYISHNKFVVLLKDDKPVAVWTGSTNVTEGGIFGHSNMAHVVEDPEVAKKYVGYWKMLWEDTDAKKLRLWNDKNTPLPRRRRPQKGVTPIFSPRGSIEALEYYAELMDSAREGVFFTAAFGVNPLLRRVLAKDKPYLRYLLLEREDKPNPNDPDIALYRRDHENLVAVGTHLTESVLERWVRTNFGEEELTGQNKHVKYIHTKYMLIDPLGDDPIVITGSANFSNASTRNNDENMLIIRGDTRVADIYLGEFMRLYTHYRFRAFAAEARRRGRPPKKLFLTEDDSWTRPYYDRSRIKMKERLLFA